MKRLLIPLLLAPSLAMAGVVIVDQVPALAKAKQVATPGAQALTDVGQESQWMIKKGQPIHIALDAWAKNAGWTLLWYPSISWKAIGDVDMKDQKDVVAAVSEVVTILRDEGKAVQLRVSEGNNVMEVLSTEVKND